MSFLKLIGINKVKPPKNLIGFDYVNFNNSHRIDELLNFNNFKNQFIKKINRFNEIKFRHLSNAKKIIAEYKALEKEIWGDNNE